MYKKNIPGKIIRFKVFQASLKNGIFLQGYLFTFFGQFLELNNCQIVSKTTIEGFPRFCKLFWKLKTLQFEIKFLATMNWIVSRQKNTHNKKYIKKETIITWNNNHNLKFKTHVKVVKENLWNKNFEFFLTISVSYGRKFEGKNTAVQ